MSGCKLRSAHVTPSGAATSLPKRGGRKQASGARKQTSKGAKATANEDEEGIGETEQQTMKGKGTSKSKKGKKQKCVACSIQVCPLTMLFSDRMVAADCAAKDNVENKKGVPAHLTP